MTKEELVKEIIKEYPSMEHFSDIAKLVHDDLEQIRTEIESFLLFCDRANEVDKNLPIILVTTDERFIAFCNKVEDLEIIVFSKGLLFVLLRMTDLMMGSTSFLPNFGNIKLEVSKQIKFF